MTVWKYARNYQRPCRECHRPMIGAARNQRMHLDCRTLAIARRKKTRRECRRAMRGLFPGEKKRLEDLVLDRRRPRRTVPNRYYCWHVCESPDCGHRFFAGRTARFCIPCAARRRRQDANRRNLAWLARHRPEILVARARRAQLQQSA